MVYSIEKHEHQLILLGKRAKVDLMRHHHLPTSRDFRIRGDVLKLAVAEQEANKVSKIVYPKYTLGNIWDFCTFYQHV